MGRNLLGDGFDISELITSESGVDRYVEGNSNSIERKIAEELVNSYTGVALSPSENELKLYKISDEELSSVAAAAIDLTFNPQILVDTVMQKLSRVSARHRIYIGKFVGQILNILHEQGHNNLEVNFREFEDVAFILRGITGTEDDRLRVSLKNPLVDHLEDQDTGMDAAFADVVVDGYVHQVGAGAKNCNFYMDVIPNWGLAPRGNCSFYIANAVQKGPVKTVDDGDWWYSVELVGNRGPSWTDGVLLGNQFYRNGNKVFIPDGDDWRELRPEKK